jgi:surface protein
MNQRYTHSVSVRLILIFFAAVRSVRVHGQDEASSICAAEGSWKTNMCAKETDFYGNVTCRERLIVLSKEGEEIDVLATMVELKSELSMLKSELSIVRSQNTELRNRLSHVEITVMPSPPPPSPPPIMEPIPDESWHTFVAECLLEAPETGECTDWASGNNYGTMPNWDTSLVDDMSYTFKDKTTFNANIGGWDTSKVTSMSSMFYQASAFNRPIGGWNTEKVTNMFGMFYKAFAFNNYIGDWNTSQVRDMQRMFWHTNNFNQDIGSWNTEKVIDMRFMFYYARSFNQDIGGWNTANVPGGWGSGGGMYKMFFIASAFNHDISSWTGPAATTAQENMFFEATSFQAKFSCTNAVNGPASSCILK